MRIALDGLLLGRYHSGVEHAIEALAETLPRVAPQHQFLLACRQEYAAQSELSLAKMPAPAWVRGRAARLAYQQLFLSGRLRPRCDLLHCPGYLMPLNWSGPAVVTVYDLIALQFPQYCKRTNVWNYRLLLPASVRRATALIVPSQRVAEDLRERFPGQAAQVRVLPLGISARYRPAAREAVTELRRRLQLPERFLLCVGNLEPKKNLPAVISAFDRLAARFPHHLVLAGRPAWGYSEVRQALRQAQAADRIHLPGYVAAADMPALYTAAELLVQWSLYEGMGLPPLEAMACGTPALISDGGALPEIAGPAAVVAPLGPPETLADAMIRLLGDSARLADLGRRGQEYSAHFTWERHARGVVALYEELAHARF